MLLETSRMGVDFGCPETVIHRFDGCRQSSGKGPRGTVNPLEIGPTRRSWQSQKQARVDEIPQWVLNRTHCAEARISRHLARIHDALRLSDPDHNSEPLNLPEHHPGQPLHRRILQNHTRSLIQNALCETCKTVAMKAAVKLERITEVDALILAAIIAIDEASKGSHRSIGILPRHAWASAVLVEQLLGALESSPERLSLSALADPQRGVIARRVSSSFDRLTMAGFLAPVGVGLTSTPKYWTTGMAEATAVAIHALRVVS